MKIFKIDNFDLALFNPKMERVIKGKWGIEDDEGNRYYGAFRRQVLEKYSEKQKDV